jgi:hypothetical protein
MPQLTICHYEDDRRGSAELEAQAAYSRMQFARKHFSDAAVNYRWALGLRYALRVACSPPGSRRSAQREAAGAAFKTVLNGRPPSAAACPPERKRDAPGRVGRER